MAPGVQEALSKGCSLPPRNRETPWMCVHPVGSGPGGKGHQAGGRVGRPIWLFPKPHFSPWGSQPPAHSALQQQHPLAPCPHRQRAGQTFVAPWVQLCRRVWPRRGPAAFPWDPPVLPRAALSRAWLKSRESRGRALPQGGSVICSPWPPCAPRPRTPPPLAPARRVAVVWGAHTKPGRVRMTQKWGLVARQAGSLCLQTLPISGSRKYR